MGFKALECRCKAKVRELERELGSPIPSDARELCRRLEHMRGRPIRLVAFDFLTYTSDLTGLWIETPLQDWIYYERHADEAHQNHIILHELGHIVFGHCPTYSWATDLPLTLFRELDTELVRGALQRARYSSVMELEAEVFATLVADDGALQQAASGNAPELPAQGLLWRIEASLEGPSLQP